MEYLVWSGAVVTVAGLFGLMWCILTVSKAKRAGLDDEALRMQLKRVVVVNLAALFASVLGLMMVVMGVFLA